MTESRRYAVELRQEDGRISKIEDPLVLFYDAGDGDRQVVPLCQWEQLQAALSGLAPEEFWDMIRHVVPDVDEPLDSMGLAPDVLDFFHGIGIQRLTEIPLEPLSEALLEWLHASFLISAVEPRKEELVAVLASMARQHIDAEKGDGQ